MINVLVTGTNIKKCMEYMDTLIDAHVYRMRRQPSGATLSPTLVLVWKGITTTPYFLNDQPTFLCQHEYGAELVRAAVWGLAALDNRFALNADLDVDHALNNLEDLESTSPGGLYVVAHSEIVRSDWKVAYKTEA